MTRARGAALAAAAGALLIGGLAYEIVSTAPVRGAVRACAELISVANRPDLNEAQRLDAARRLCSKRLLRSRPLSISREGGLVGVPRNVDKNFTAERHGESVWVSPMPAHRGGRAVYQFVFEDGRWKFDGLVGLQMPRGEFVPADSMPAED